MPRSMGLSGMVCPLGIDSRTGNVSATRDQHWIMKKVVGRAILLKDHHYVLNEMGAGQNAFGTSTATI